MRETTQEGDLNWSPSSSHLAIEAREPRSKMLRTSLPRLQRRKEKTRRTRMRASLSSRLLLLPPPEELAVTEVTTVALPLLEEVVW